MHRWDLAPSGGGGAQFGGGGGSMSSTCSLVHAALNGDNR